jgi:peptide-methionine (S)-S-oxide reductase
LINLLETGHRILSRRAAEGLHNAMAIQTHLFSRFWGYSWSIFALSTVLTACGAPATELPIAVAIPASTVKGTQTAVFSGGCFWGVEAVFEHLKGVSEVVSGYSGDKATTANYETVSTGQTNQAESVKVTYDPSQISYNQLLKVFFLVAHDPTQLNRQGPDSGPQYRSTIFFTNSEQQRAAKAYISQLNKAHLFRQPIVTQLIPLSSFYAAEEYHQNFIARNPYHPYVVVNDAPKLKQLQEQFSEMYKA